MKPNIIVSLAVLFLLGQATPSAHASDLPLTSENFEGASWNFNFGPTPFDLPLPASEGRSIFASTDFSWRQVRSRQQFTGPWILDAEVLPRLQSGGVNGDWGYVGFGTGWARYQGQWAGLVVHDGTAYAYEINRPNVDPVGITTQMIPIGDYRPGVPIEVTVDLLPGGHIRIQGPGIAGNLTLSVPAIETRTVLAVANSIDGIELASIQTTELTAPIDPPVELEVYAGITVLGEVGGRYAIESKDSINQPGAWNLLTTLTLTGNRQVFIDVSSARVPSRVYRSRRLP
jgi:hypothetical protein